MATTSAATTDKLPIPAISKYLDHPGDQTIPMHQWMPTFDHFLIIADANRTTKLTSTEKNSLLYMHLGMEGGRILQANPVFTQMDLMTWGNFREAVIKQFATPISKVKAQFEFMQRHQETSETADEFITALRHMATDCDFGNSSEERIAIQLIVGCRDSKARQLCLRLDQINLDEVITIIRTEELADTTAVAVGSKTAVGKIHTSQRPPRFQCPNTSRFAPRKAPALATQRNRQTQQTCMGCGAKDHCFRSEQCPAKGQRCSFCQTVDHFARACIKKQKQGQTKQITNDPQIQVTRMQKKKILATVSVSDGTSFKPVIMEIDMGADTTTMTESTYKQHFWARPLKPQLDIIRNYDSTLIKGIYGSFLTKIQIFGRTAQDWVHVVPDNHSTILGTNFLQPLKVLVNCETQEIQDATVNNIVRPCDRVLQQQTIASIKTAEEWKDSIIANNFPRLLDDNLGTFPKYQHRIFVEESAQPKTARVRPVPLARREAVNREVENMERMGIWEKVDSSDWIHPMVTVPKADGTVRITTDLSPINPAIRPTHHPIPNVRELFLELSTAQYFSKIDLRKGYYHIQLHPDSRKYTTTITHQGLYQYKRLPMGLKDAAQSFQRCVTQTLAGAQGVISYIDDILVYGKTLEEHNKNLTEVLRRLHKNDFRLNIEKCKFATQNVNFLGHNISDGKIAPDPKNIAPILAFKEPSSKKEVQVFLGMVNYYSEFIEDVSSIAEPLRKLTRKGEPFQWTKETEISFNTLKKMIGEKLSLYIYDPAAPTIVTTDASDVGIGAVLSQIQNRREVPIAFASHTLSPTERRYSTSEREALACVWAVENWEKFLLGRHFTLRTDHSALQTLLKSHKSARSTSKFSRWLERLSAFDYTPVYHAGNQNKVADALSRLETKATTYGICSTTATITYDIIKAATAEDAGIQQIRQYINTYWPRKNTMTPEVRGFFQIRNQLRFKDGILYKGQRIVAPNSIHRAILESAHTGHPGIVRMKRKLRETYWWRGMDKQAELKVQTCGPCQRSDKSTPRSTVPETKIPWPNTPAKHYALDITGPFYNNTYIVALVDYYSNYPELLITKDTTSRKITKWLDEIFSRYGLPDRITTDNGPQFISSEFEQYLKQRDIHHHLTAIYNPRENGLVEAFNRPLKYAVQTLTEAGTSFEEGLLQFLANYRATPPTPDVLSPAECFLGHRNRLPFQPMLDIRNNIQNDASLSQHLQRSATTKPIHRSLFKKGEKVIAKIPQVRKGMPPFSKPMNIVEVLGYFTYRLSDGKKYNARRLKPWRQETTTMIHDAPTTKPQPVSVPRRSQRTTKGRPPQRFDPCRHEAGGRH